MVLQRGMEVPVWGTAAAGSEVTVTFADQTVSGTVHASGKWRVLLPSMAASADGKKMTVAGDGKVIAIADVLVGDVWVGSGQSNMAGKVASYSKKDETLARLVENAPYPKIRLMNGGPKPVWKLATAENINGFSAILFAFGERLQRDLDVPIGMIVGAVGGTPSGYWIPSEVYESSKQAKAEVAEFAKAWDPEKAMKQHEAKVALWERRVAEATAAGEKPKGRKPSPPVDPGASTRGGKIGGLFDKYIRNSVGYGIRGVLWDQGEAGSGIFGLDQHTCMSELIRGWRELWGQGNFPFLFVQKPSGMGNAFSNEDPITREANAFQALPEKDPVGDGGGRYLYTRLMLDNENSWMVPAIDLGPTIHPLNKWGYGNRAAEAALQMAYQVEGIQAYGPIYDSHRIDGNKVSVRFTQTGRGLTIRHSDALQGFTLAGKDGVWHWANATISDDDTVTVSSGAVPSPTQVRFAYAKDRTWANLFNKDGLPALAFTTE
ncbi:MAG: sialate O-acetylesterase [Verrucomicrobiales bacterium]|nr:sialate O-acetylesterase [Verrucomicrobiales bacterium]